MSEFRPDVVIGVGGYASGPAMLAAIVRRIPTLAFEPNVVPGFANRMVARFVSEAAVHFAETAKYFRRCSVTGVPVRQAFFDVANNRSANPTLLVFGGSQGAHAINQAVLDATALLRERIPTFTSSIRRESVTIMMRKLRMQMLVEEPRSIVLLMTCPHFSLAWICCSVVREPAPWRK